MKVVVKTVFNDIPRIKAGMNPKAGEAVRSTAIDISYVAKRSMSGNKTGLEYKRSGGKSHRASAPGEAPAIDSGELVNSIQNAQIDQLTAMSFSNMEYAPHLEFGTVHMAKRPFYVPAAEQAFPEFQKQMLEIFEI